MYVTSGPAHAIRVLSQSCCDFCRPKCISLPSDRFLLLPWCYCLLIPFCVFQIGCQYLWTICPFFLDFSTWQFVLYGHSTFTAFSGRTFCLCRSVLSFLVIRLFISFKGLCWSVECLLLHWSLRFFLVKFFRYCSACHHCRQVSNFNCWLCMSQNALDLLIDLLFCLN